MKSFLCFIVMYISYSTVYFCSSSRWKICIHQKCLKGWAHLLRQVVIFLYPGDIAYKRYSYRRFFLAKIKILNVNVKHDPSNTRIDKNIE